MSEYSSIHLNNISNVPNDVCSTYKYLVTTPKGVTYTVTADKLIPKGTITIDHLDDTVSNTYAEKDYVTAELGKLGSASKCGADSFAPASLATCPGLKCTGTSNLALGTTSTTAAKGNHNHDSTYSKVDHNHDSTYSNVDHNHDDTYLGKSANAASATSAEKLSKNYICFGTNCLWIGD